MNSIQKISFLVSLWLVSQTSLAQGIFKNEIEGIDIKQSSKEIYKIHEVMNRYTYAFCSTQKLVKEYKNGGYEKVSNLYNIIGLYTDIDTTYAHKIVLERVVIKEKKTYYNSFKTSMLLNEVIDKDKVWDFFVSLKAYQFHKLDNKCLTNMTFPNPKDSIYTYKTVSITHLQDQRMLIFADNKLREIRSSAPRYIFQKYPNQNSCRAIFIICKNLFYDRIWD